MADRPAGSVKTSSTCSSARIGTPAAIVPAAGHGHPAPAVPPSLSTLGNGRARPRGAAGPPQEPPALEHRQVMRHRRRGAEPNHRTDLPDSRRIAVEFDPLADHRQDPLPARAQLGRIRFRVGGRHSRTIPQLSIICTKLAGSLPWCGHGGQAFGPRGASHHGCSQGVGRPCAAAAAAISDATSSPSSWTTAVPAVLVQVGGAALHPWRPTGGAPDLPPPNRLRIFDSDP